MIKGIVVFLLSLLLTTDVVSFLLMIGTNYDDEPIMVFIISGTITLFIGIFVWLWCNLNI